jgi:uncharacterized protein
MADVGQGAELGAPSIRVEVVYALPQRAWRVSLQLPAGSTALAAFEASGLRQRVP